VEFASDVEAAEAIRLFQDRDLEGRKLRIDMAGDRPGRAGGGGPYGAGGSGFSSGPRPGGGAAPAKRPFRSKGSRRGIRGRKRSL
jgi:hypothetical protein